MTEKEFRLQKLEQYIPQLRNKKLALYGTGANAKEILSRFPELNVIALMDELHIGEYIYGKKIISREQALMIGIDVIVIAAEASSAFAVSERIRFFCRNNHILLLNMYGYNEFELYNKILSQELCYTSNTREDLKSRIEKHDVICFQLIDVLCAYPYYDKLSFWDVLETNYLEDDKFSISHFARNRKKAKETMGAKKQFYSLETVYNVLQTLTFISKEESKLLYDREEHAIVNCMIPKRSLIDIVNWAGNQGKAIYIVSELHISSHSIKNLLKKLGITNYKGIIQENILNISISKGALRMGLGEDFGRKTLYIGTNRKYSLWMPQMYHMDIYLLKDSWEIMEQFSDLGIKKEDFAGNEKKNNITELVQSVFNSPFVRDNEGIDKQGVFEISGEVKENNSITDFRQPDLYPIPDEKAFDQLEILHFSEYDTPMVSIIIPVYNQFVYTYNCLKSILHNTEKIPYEIILADDCSDDSVAKMEEVVQGIRILHNDENLLFLRNCNQAAKLAKGKYIVFLNNDTQVQLNWLYPLVHILETCPDAGMAGSKLLYPDGRLQEAGGIIWKDGTAWNYGHNDNPDLPKYNYVREADYISGASIIIYRDLWEEIGGFDERYAPAYCEDSDLAFEVRKRNRKVLYQPASVVVHFEGVSNGTDVTDGVKRYQAVNMIQLSKKWKDVLERENHVQEKNIMSIRDRKGDRKLVLVISNIIPKYDCDAGSKTLIMYLKLFLKKGYIVKFVSENFDNSMPYAAELQQMGIEVFYGAYFKSNFNVWLLKNQQEIDFVLLNYPLCTIKFLNALKCTSIKLRYYGMDLHFLRNQREYELTKDLSKLELSKDFYEKEKYIIQNVEKIYYPSDVEVDIVKNTFRKKDVKLMRAFMYDMESLPEYIPDVRKGIMFIGGYGHPPNVDAVLWFVKEVYPLIYEVKKIPFYIVGANEPVEIQKIKHPGIVHKGHLTDNELEELYRDVRMAVIPLRYGAGIKGKVVDAMYQGVPMVSTAIGIEGIPEAEKYMEVADEASDFAKKVLMLYEDKDKLLNISANCRNIIQTYFSEEAAWDMIKDDF